jgi:tRNA nucleotidyltransferase (CCA-adding enzyme)
LSDDPIVRFAALTHDLGKAVTPKDKLPSHHGHEGESVKILDALCERLRVPKEYRDCAAGVARYHGNAHRVQELRHTTLLDLLDNLDAFRRPARFEQFVLACEADARGRTGLEKRDYPQAQYLRKAREVAAAVKLPPEKMSELTGPQIAEQVRAARIAALKKELGAEKA